MDATPAPGTARHTAKRVLPPHPLRAVVVIGVFTGVLYLVELINLTAFQGNLIGYGIVPRTLTGLEGVIWAPLLHGNWEHLASNTIPVLVFGFLAMSGGTRQWIAVTACIWLISGLGVWLIGPPNESTIGASGLAFGWLAFLLVRGLFNRSFGQIVVAMVLLFYWGSTLWGLLPGRPDISWQAHLFGAFGGVLAAWLAARATPPTPSDRPTPAQPGSLTA